MNFAIKEKGEIRYGMNNKSVWRIDTARYGVKKKRKEINKSNYLESREVNLEQKKGKFVTEKLEKSEKSEAEKV